MHSQFFTGNALGWHPVPWRGTAGGRVRALTSGVKVGPLSGITLLHLALAIGLTRLLPPLAGALNNVQGDSQVQLVESWKRLALQGWNIALARSIEAEREWALAAILSMDIMSGPLTCFASALCGCYDVQCSGGGVKCTGIWTSDRWHNIPRVQMP